MDVALLNQRADAFAGDNLGWRLETVVLLHLMKRCKQNGWDLYYLKERSGECDFIVCSGKTVMQAIQVSYGTAAEKTRKREINGLLLANRQTQCEDLLLLTAHEYGDMVKDGHRITIRPVYDWSISL